MTRVLVLSDLWLPFPGGAERLMYNIARDLAERDGFDVDVVTGYEAAQRFDGPRVIAEAIGDGDGDPGWTPVETLIDVLRPDVIVTHHHYARLFQAELAATGIPLVQIVLNGPRHVEPSLAVYITEHIRRLAGPHVSDHDLTILPPAFPDVVAETHGDQIGFIKPIPHKGVDLLYRIAEAMPDRRFLVLRGEWQTLETIRRLRNVEFMEPVTDIREFWERCRLVLVPSLSEDAGTVAQEATLNGIPCLSSDVDGLAETNAGGVLIQPGVDQHGWAREIEWLDDPAMYAVVVARMLRAYEAHDIPGKLDALAAQIAELAR